MPFRHGLKEPPRWHVEAKSDIPNRYEVREVDHQRVLRCKEAPGLAVRIDRGFAFTESEARKLGEHTILLDGAGQFAPLLDDSRHLYNLDHHSGCSRAFTLATCEQALILVLKGLGLDKGDWTIYANEPDLDTIFAIWALLNYRRVRDLQPAARDAVFPLFRLEGAIDANGFEIAEACGLLQETLHHQKALLDALHQRELEVKQSGTWAELDLAEYTLGMLLELDRMVFTGADFSDFTSVEKEHGHVNIGKDLVAVICRDTAGIYDVEKRLKKVWGDRLGMIALEKDRNHYTLRRTATLAGINLEAAYERLNLLDPAVDGKPPEKRWGGSDDIGGSPRPGGTGLVPREVGKILKLTYAATRRWTTVQRSATAALWSAGLMLIAGGIVFGWQWLGERPATPLNAALELAMFGAISVSGAWYLTRKLSRGWTWLFGWRARAGEDWLALIPLVLLGAAAGGAWIPRQVAFEPGPLAASALAVIIASLGLELTFRGLTHGLLILDSRVQNVGGRWFLSRPAVISAGLYALMTWIASQGLIAPSLPWPASFVGGWASLLVGAMLAGVALGMIRERSLSVWVAFAVQALAGLLRLGLELWHRF